MRKVFATALIGCLGVFSAASAGDFFETQGIAISGYDPVAYFTKHEAAVGSSSYTYTYHGSAFRFVSAQDRDLFVANPTKYAPQYRGFCTYGVSENAKVPSNPKAFRIVDDKLYLNYNPAVAKKFDQDVAGNLAKANHNWPGLEDKQPQK